MIPPRNQSGSIRRTVRAIDPTEQSWAPQPPAVAPFDPAAGFPWPPDDSQSWSVIVYDATEQAWAIATSPVLDPATGSAWVNPADETTSPSGYDSTEQAWAVVGPPFLPLAPDEPSTAPLAFDATTQAWSVQPPAAAVFDPSAGFPWPTGDAQPLAVIVFDPAEQAWAVIAAPFIGTDDAAPVTAPATFDDTAQSWTVQPPVFDPSASPWTSAADEAVVRAGYDPTEQSWSVQPVAPPFEPSTGVGWTLEETRPTPAGYDATEQAWAVQPVGAAPLFDPSSGTAWNDPGRDVIAQPVWTDDVGTVFPAAPFIGNEPGPASLSAVWFDGTDQAYTIQPPVLDVASLAGLWTYADPTQDRSLQPVWYDPSDLGSSWAATLGDIRGIVGATFVVANSTGAFAQLRDAVAVASGPGSAVGAEVGGAQGSVGVSVSIRDSVKAEIQ